MQGPTKTSFEHGPADSNSTSSSGVWAENFAALMAGDAKAGYEVNAEENWVKLRVDKPRSGHDATPKVFALHGLSTSLAVADGMGGRGAQKLARTCHAALASRLVLQMIPQVIGGLVNSGSHPESAKLIETQLHNKLKAAWSGAVREGLAEVSAFGGSLVSNLPTTFTMAEVARPPAAPGLPFVVNTYNCGDSRVYALEAAARGGLAALTIDDTRTPVDALTALIDDPPLARFITADRVHPITFGSHSLRSPCLVFACSDGFHHYFRTPLGVEVLLRKAMTEAVGEPDALDAFARHLERYFADHLHDDVSAAILVVGGSAASVFASLTAPKAESERLQQLAAEEEASAADPKSTRQIWENHRKADYERYTEGAP